MNYPINTTVCSVMPEDVERIVIFKNEFCDYLRSMGDNDP